ncbi:hypothetical protein AA313_de0200821 [Arthrobotrys entomopaga]|nr:hypothetical protein AA313_de0200821 [Arthrobotrys entomopaga]
MLLGKLHSSIAGLHHEHKQATSPPREKVCQTAAAAVSTVSDWLKGRTNKGRALAMLPNNKQAESSLAIETKTTGIQEKDKLDRDVTNIVLALGFPSVTNIVRRMEEEGYVYDRKIQDGVKSSSYRVFLS